MSPDAWRGYSRESLKAFLRSQGLSCEGVSGLYMDVVEKKPAEYVQELEGIAAVASANTDKYHKTGVWT